MASEPKYFTTVEDLSLNELGAEKFIKEHINTFPTYLVSEEFKLKIVNPRELGEKCF